MPPAVWARPGCRGARPRASASSHPHPARSDLCASPLSAGAGDRLEPPGGICRSWRRRLTPLSLSRLTDAHLAFVVLARFHVRSWRLHSRDCKHARAVAMGGVPDWPRPLWVSAHLTDENSVTHSGKITLCYKYIIRMINIDAGYDVMIWREWQLYLDKNKQND